MMMIHDTRNNETIKRNNETQQKNIFSLKKIRPIDPNLSLNLYKSNEEVKVLLIDTHSAGLFFGIMA